MNPESFRAYKILIAAQYSGADVKVISEPPRFRLGVTNKEKEFLDKFPLGKVRDTAVEYHVMCDIGASIRDSRRGSNI